MHRVMSLTADTSKVLVITLRGLESLVKYLLSKDIKYIMLGDMQSDRIEGELGAYRQLNGGNYYMSADHVENALKLHRIKLFSSLEVDDIVWHSQNECCHVTLNDDELECLPKAFECSSKISEIERSSLYYICGYVCFKEGIHSDKHKEVANCPESEFTTEVSRCKLFHPTEDIFELGLYVYAYYQNIQNKTCINKLLNGFIKIYEVSHFKLPNIQSILCRFDNSFSKGCAKKETEKIKRSSKSIKHRRLER